jgi:Glycosyltransferase family 25 (LPS biosynthesis protein)
MVKTETLSDYFACTYAINLAERKDRRREIVDELERVGMPLTPGKVQIFEAVKPKDRLGFASVNVLGCFLSHYRILVDALERQLPNVLVVEDDLVIMPALRDHLDLYLATLRSVDWGIVYLGHIEPVPDTAAAELVRFEQPVITAHFYAVNGKVLPRLVEFLTLVQQREEGHPLGGPQDFDGALTMFRMANPDVVTLLAHPNMGKQRPSRSNIRPPWYERLPVVKQAADLARVVRNRIQA